MGGFAPKSVRPHRRRSMRFKYSSRSMRKYSCSAPICGVTFSALSPKSFSTRTVARLTAAMERSSGVFLSSAWPL